MKNLLAASIFSLALALPAYAETDVPAAPEQAPKTETAQNDKILYSLGYMAGETIKTQLILNGEEDFKAVSQGMRDSLLDRNSQTDLEIYKPLVVKKYEEDSQTLIANRKIKQNEFLTELKKVKKNKTLANGTVITEVKAGKGKAPKPSSIVKVHYEGSLLDGTVFDSSVKRGEPAQLSLSGVIGCWTEGLQQMKAGGKAKLYCPPEIAYGDRQAGSIPPGSLLVFDVELLEVTTKDDF
jgi:FKBP-type peptidyl-prolyl cis-trans isomerase